MSELDRVPNPSALRLPAEWEEQSAVWFSWPWRETLWPDCLPQVQNRLIELYALCAEFQPVHVLCPKGDQARLNKAFQDRDLKQPVLLHDYASDDVWIRDYGPIFLRKGASVIASDWRFNAWGEKYPSFARDNGVPAWISSYLGIEHVSEEIVLEGGAIESNGSGLLVTTSAVLQNKNRFKGEFPQKIPSRSEWESQLESRLGVRSVLWFEHGLSGDDTDGHIDNLIRFAPGKRILYAAESDRESPNFAPLNQLKETLLAASDCLNGYTLTALALPDPIHHRGQLLAASYANFLVLNGAVIVPIFQQLGDVNALKVISECFPNRSIRPFDCSEIIREGGGLHCLSLNQPAPT